MKKILLYTLLAFISVTPFVKADMYVPEFDKMQIIKCEIDETLYNQDGSVVSQTNYHRLFRLDDENNIIYIQKEPANRIFYYGNDKIEFRDNSMTDDSMVVSNISINRADKTYTSSSQITYDNPDFGSRYAKAEGNCVLQSK